MYPGEAANLTSNTRVVNWLIRDASFEDIVPNADRCPAVTQSLIDAIGSPDMAKLADKYADTLKAMNDALGTQVSFTFDSLIGMLVCNRAASSAAHKRCSFPHLVVFPFCCPVVLLSCCPVVLLSCCPVVLLSCCPVVLLSICPVVLLSCCLLSVVSGLSVLARLLQLRDPIWDESGT
jgi:hypothetical protein